MQLHRALSLLLVLSVIQSVAESQSWLDEVSTLLGRVTPTIEEFPNGDICVSSSTLPTLVRRLDRSGAVLWERSYADRLSVVDMTTLDDGGVVLVLAQYQEDVFFQPPTKTGIAVLNADGTVRSEHTYRRADLVELFPWCVGRARDWSRVFVGGSARLFGVFDYSTSDAHWFELDGAGLPLGSSGEIGVGGQNAMAANEIVPTEDGGLLISTSDGNRLGIYPSYFTEPFNMTTSVVQLDAAGNKVWDYFVDPQTRIADVAATPDGGAVAVGEYHETETSGSDALIIRFDSAGQILWSQTLLDPTAPTIPRVSESAIAVDVSPLGIVVAVQSDRSRGMFARLDDSGAIIWQRQFLPLEGPYRIVDVAWARDGHLLLAGTASSRLYIGRVEPNGTIDGCASLVPSPYSITSQVVPPVASTVVLAGEPTPLAFGVGLSSGVPSPSPRVTLCSSPFPRTLPVLPPGGALGASISFEHDVPSLPGATVVTLVSTSGPANFTLSSGLVVPLLPDMFSAIVLSSPAGVSVLDGAGSAVAGPLPIPNDPLLAGLVSEVCGLCFETPNAALTLVTQPETFTLQ